uniref:Probable beta-hexosaminidase fdl n=1 Tax=Culex pipiens TaxID=7175 RepID=A0A8D8A424_CULPI
MLLANDYFNKRNSQQRNLRTTVLTNFIKKMAFTGSLRKTLFGLLLVMVFLVMFLYWNENTGSLKPAGSALIFAGIFNRDGGGQGAGGGGALGGMPPPKINPPEKTWTYRCVNNRCVRQHYIEQGDSESSYGGSTPGKRVPFLTCTMTCGPINIWPQPTAKATIGSKTSRFRLADLNVHIKAAAQPVEGLLRDAFGVFKEELRATLVAHGAAGEDGEVVAAAASLVTESGKEPGKEPSADGKIHFYKPVDENRYDVDKFDVRITVLKSPDVYLTMQTDESYNLSVTREFRVGLGVFRGWRIEIWFCF